MTRPENASGMPSSVIIQRLRRSGWRASSTATAVPTSADTPRGETQGERIAQGARQQRIGVQPRPGAAAFGERLQRQRGQGQHEEQAHEGPGGPGAETTDHGAPTWPGWPGPQLVQLGLAGRGLDHVQGRICGAAGMRAAASAGRGDIAPRRPHEALREQALADIAHDEVEPQPARVRIGAVLDQADRIGRRHAGFTGDHDFAGVSPSRPRAGLSGHRFRSRSRPGSRPSGTWRKAWCPPPAAHCPLHAGGRGSRCPP